MKTKILFLIIVALSCSCLQAQTTAIPDDNFEYYLETHTANGSVVDIGDETSMGDGIENNNLVFTDRINTVVSLIISDLGVSDVTGIEDFDALEVFICNNNSIETIDVSNNINLKSLLCSSNLLINLDVSANVNLEDLDCSSNQITVVDFVNNTLLETINCSNNRIAVVDVSQNTNLSSLRVSDNRITDLQLNNNLVLESLFCASNQISILDISVNTNIKTLDVSNNQILNLDLSTINTVVCPEPQTDPVTICQGDALINVSNNELMSLVVANGFNNLITSFSSEGNPDLFCIQIDTGFTTDASWTNDDWTYYADVVCADLYTYVPDDNFEQALINLGLDNVLDNLVLTSNINGLVVLDVSNQNIEDLTGIKDFGALANLNCSVNAIETLDISNNNMLTDLNVSGNNLASLDLSDNPNLAVLNVSNNTLTSLDLNNNTLLDSLDCSGNSIQTLDLSIHPSITNFNCEFNALQALSIKNGQNANLANFNAINNTDLFCIETDIGIVPGGVVWTIDATANYAANCGTYIPDTNFEQALIDLGLDTAPLDNYVTTANISGVVNLDINTSDIADLTGIEDFLALEVLDCSNNVITSLNLTGNLALTNVNCSTNALEFVDIRNGTNNAQLVTFDATNNPNLFCINVDDENYSRNAVGWNEDVNDIYNNDCVTNRYTPIPDDNFEQVLIELGIDNGAADNQVLTANIEFLTSLNVSGRNIESLVGIQAFVSLVELDCSNNYLDELDVSGMRNLEKLFCGSNYFLTNNAANANGVLNTTGTVRLTELFCADNSLTDLDISQYLNLEVLDCSNNNLEVLDISNNNSLVEINCDNNQISNFISYAVDNTTLTKISCNNNEIPALLVNRCLALKTLNCRSNVLNLLDISSNNALEILDASDNELDAIDLSSNTNLITLSAAQNQLTEIDGLTSAVLEALVLNNNEITQLNTVLAGLPSVKYLSVNDNRLTNVDTRFNTNLIELNISNNQIETLQLPNNINQLKTLNCSRNIITGDLDLTTMGIGACPAKNINNPLDFCPESITINISNNQLEFINIQNGINADISSFAATGNSNLTCIQVDNVNAIGVNWVKDDTTNFSEECRFGETFVPDDNFEQALIALGYDVGPLDDYVPTANIEIVTNLDISGNTISDITGIEDFLALQVLNCSNNNLSAIDFSSNANLVEINCANNVLSDLDVTNSTNITSISIANNLFTAFNTSAIPTLQQFNCESNSIVELDFSANTALTNLNCGSNVLEVLNLQNGQNLNLLNLNAQNNPNLSCIQTDNGEAPGGVSWLKDATTTYAINCRFGQTFVPDDNFEQALITLGYDEGPLDDYVLTANIQNLVLLDISGYEINDATGIEDFENLTSLNVSNNEISTIDITSNILLTNIDASGNMLAVLDISNQQDLKVLDISNNNFTQIDFTSNLDIVELNIATNSFATLNVDILLDLERLNCASNQLTELSVSLNTKLRELVCSSNLLFQDNLNIQNGTNEILSNFNATNNPDLTCILVDDPAAVRANENGFFNSWFKDASSTYQLICDDADNDGVANEDDLCPGTPFGEPVDLFGCRFNVLPDDNFTILITDETCLNNNDGEIQITTKTFYEYKVNVKGENFDRDYTFTNTINILNMLEGAYRLCITSEALPNFERCFDVIIKHPENLKVITGKRKNGKAVSFDMSGSSKYIVDFNGLVFTTSKSEITLQLEQGNNTIKISTDKPCQGSHEEQIFLSNKMFVYPNPFQNQFNIYFGDVMDDRISVSICSYLGQLVYHKDVIDTASRNLTIETGSYNSGLYTVTVKSSNGLSTFKMVKK